MHACVHQVDELTPRSWTSTGGCCLKKYSEQVKPAAVEAYRTGELGWKRTAALHELEPSSLRKWVAAFDVHGLNANVVHRWCANDSRTTHARRIELPSCGSSARTNYSVLVMRARLLDAGSPDIDALASGLFEDCADNAHASRMNEAAGVCKVMWSWCICTCTLESGIVPDRYSAVIFRSVTTLPQMADSLAM